MPLAACLTPLFYSIEGAEKGDYFEKWSFNLKGRQYSRSKLWGGSNHSQRITSDDFICCRKETYGVFHRLFL